MITTEGGSFEITVNPEMWTGGNAKVALTVIPSIDNLDPSKTLNGEPALCFVSNAFRPFAPNQPQDQVLIGELNGVFAHVRVMHGRVYVVMADRRLN